MPSAFSGRFPVFRLIRPLLALLALLLVPLAPAQGQGAGKATTDEMLAERVLGNPKAPITIIEYFSLTCSHCADFHVNTLPQLKKEWVETGKARLVMRDFPLDRVALHGAVLARCLPGDKYFAFVDMLMTSQKQWASAPDPRVALNGNARLAGLSKEKIDACVADTALTDGILARQLEGQQKFKIQSTPTFVIDGKTFPGAMPFAQFDRILKGQ
ncbi:MAG: DsbA family protein [Rhodospirillales bacterium]|nr:DsbA family protein [Rhodospirillales bacterium]